MGYAAARGGLTAIKEAEALVARLRDLDASEELDLDQFTGRLRLLVDRVMGEAGIWAPQLASISLRQAEGDVIEAVHLLRAYKSTLPRLGVARVVHANDLVAERRIVPAFRDPGGPQLLGRSTDYTARMLKPHADGFASRYPDVPDESLSHDTTEPPRQSTHSVNPRFDRMSDVLRSMDLLVDRRRIDDPEPVDITRTPVRPPAPRSALLSTMARAETGSLVNLWYRNILGPDGYLHEVTLGEVRHGALPIEVRHPYAERPVKIGEYRVTEVEAIEDLDGIEEDRTKFDVGYGMCLGHNERKAIAMANLDIGCHRDGSRSSLEQSILMTTDSLDSAGFLEHLKLPHYVTFRSMVERKQAMKHARETQVKGSIDIAL